MSWIDRIFSKGTSSSASRKANVPEGVWTKCTSCEQVLYGEEVKRNLYVCPKCGRKESEHEGFERIRRITGYLVGTLDRFNDAKRAEEAQRVKHGISDED